MTSTDQLTTSLSLRCEEMMEASPSTSSTSRQIRDYRRRSGRHAFQPMTNQQKRLSYCPVQNRKRPSDDSRLNSPVSSSVSALPDRALQLDDRVMANLKVAETNRQPNAMYFVSVQTDIETEHRRQIVEWLSEVCMELHCEPDVLPLAVSTLDRFLSLKRVPKTELQLAAGVCLFIASKLKAPTPLNADNLVYWSDRAILPENVLPMEMLILQTLDWDVSCPTPLDFFDQIRARLPHVGAVRQQFIEISHGILKNHKMATLLPSIQCGVALLSAAKRFSLPFYREIVGMNQYSVFTVPGILGVECQLLTGLLPQVNRIMGHEEYRQAVLTSGIQAPPCSQRTPTPPTALQAVKGALLSTPNNDSGFSSAASSPESACKEKMDCTPPKIGRA